GEENEDVENGGPFANYLQQQDLLTAWQNRKLLKGRYRQLMFGKFRVMHLLGVGGMGRVYLAENRLLEKKVALKVLPSARSHNPSSLARFQREARALARLNHPNIVRIHDIDVQDQTHYIVMEYVDGRDMHAIVSSKGPLDGAAAADLISQTAAGLQHAHSAGMIHRDVKPANLLLTSGGVVKISDMGLALLETDSNPAITVDQEKTLGTADYISPEQAISSRNIDSRTDLYSLGCTLFFLLCGHAPFHTGSSVQRLMAHQNIPPPDINEIRKGLELPPVEPSLIAVCQRLMAKSADDRFASAADVVRALTPMLSNASSDRQSVLAEISSGAGQPVPIPESISDLSHTGVETDAMDQLRTVTAIHTDQQLRRANSAGASSSRTSTAQPKTRRGQPWWLWSSLGIGATAAIGIGILLAMQSLETVSGTNSTGEPSESSIPLLDDTAHRSGQLFVIGDNQTYHRHDCRHCNGKTNLRAVSLAEIQARGLKPCRVCKP
ncbi:MAG: serine/threonine-protein kinase, partial [Planctomycetota bacterium]